MRLMKVIRTARKLYDVIMTTFCSRIQLAKFAKELKAPREYQPITDNYTE